MEYKHIKEIDFAANIQERVFGLFMAKTVDIRVQKDQVTKYICLNMVDKDFSISAKKFGATDSEIEAMQNGKIYCAAIDVKKYDKDPLGFSCILYNFEEVNMDPNEFIDWADGMDEAQRIIQGAFNIIGESIYKDLVYNIVTEHWGDFTVWTAASSLHHNQLGGLFVHTAEVIAQSEQIADFWENKYGPNFINKELLLSGALLHDIAKTQELDVDKLSGTTEYSTRASLETHITMCVSRIDVEAYKLKLGYQEYRINELNEAEGIKSEEQLQREQEAVSLLRHLILAHHGKLEYGSPISMNVPEAYILNTADLLSSEMYRFNRTFNNMDAGTSNCVWLSGVMVNTYKESIK